LSSFFCAFVPAVLLCVVAGLSYGGVPFVLTLVFWCLGVLCVFAAGFCLFFFRDPKINIEASLAKAAASGLCPSGRGPVLCPCNGTVIECVEEKGMRVVRMFLSILNVHLQRAPLAGKVVSVEHRKGRFYAAWNPRAPAENEQNVITLETAAGTVIVRQIAGFVARRCIAWVKPGDEVRIGQRIGLIRFGSQVDLHLPPDAQIVVKPGDKVRSGVTLMGTVGEKK
jgi:phosphatidylserine decarboxylase